MNISKTTQIELKLTMVEAEVLMLAVQFPCDSGDEETNKILEGIFALLKAALS